MTNHSVLHLLRETPSLILQECDTGTAKNSGCNPNCTRVEPRDAWNCPPGGGVCSPFACGDGLIAFPIESCDDSNVLDGDGCSSSCQLEFGWSCVAPGIGCTAVRALCNDTRRAQHNYNESLNEQCDDVRMIYIPAAFLLSRILASLVNVDQITCSHS